MPYDFVIKNGRIVNEGSIQKADIAVRRGRIDRIDENIDSQAREVIADGELIIPGIIDDQVHFREPGLTHKAEIYTEAQAGVAGGVTSYMEMPNTKPPALTQDLLQEKYDIAARRSLANYSFYMGISNDNLEEVLKTDIRQVCGLKAFMGSSTGNMLVDDPATLDNLFKNAHMLIATHCEDETTMKRRTQEYIERYGDRLTAAHHPEIRSREGCLISSQTAVELAKKYDTRLHVLHISTAEETHLFEAGDRNRKRITSEACVHHLTFNSMHYEKLGNKIKCNPAIKNESDRRAIWKALHEGRIDVIATDHAPHTLEEKESPYMEAPAGLPLVQHTLYLMLKKVNEGEISLPFLVDKMCHAPADLFDVKERGYLREGYFADLVIVDPDEIWTVDRSNILHKCGWSPLEGWRIQGKVKKTFVSGHLAYNDGKFNESRMGDRLVFDR
ncbi:MAG: dihydroorotase [Saprospiraceae bacterium]|nr:dihydroorotase [Saprospiraceae bacterium]